MKEALFYEKLDNNKVRCRLCPHECILQHDGTGVCRARRNTGGRLYSLNYSCVTSIALDPIEKKPLYHFHPGSLILSAGTFGCSFRCSWCQNWTIAQRDTRANARNDARTNARNDARTNARNDAPTNARNDARANARNDAPTNAWNDTRANARNDARTNARNDWTIELTPEGLAELAQEYAAQGSIGVAYTYNEPSIWYEFVLESSMLVREKGLANVLVTNGFINKEPLEQLLPFTDAMNIDVKAFTREFYVKYCKGGLDSVKATVERAARSCHVEITTLVIPGLNDSPGEIGSLASWLASIDPEIVLHLSRFFPNYQMNDVMPTPRETLEAARESALEHLKHVYLGNI